jgi:hypothetical protein
LNGKVGPLPSGTLDATLPAITTAAPEVASSSNTGFDESNSGTTVTIPVPVPTAAGQIALLAMELWGYDPDVAVTWPAGFTECVHVVESAYMQQKLVAAWKRLTEADTGDYVATLSLPHYNQGQCLLISGAVASGDPIEATNTASGSGTDVPSTSVTTAAPPFLVHLVAVARYQFDATPATGYTFLYKGSDLLSSQRIPRAIGSHTASGATVDYGDLAVALVAIKPEIQQMGGSVTPPPPAGISEWDGAARQSLRLVGVWDGAAVQPVSDGWWTGSAVAPVEH